MIGIEYREHGFERDNGSFIRGKSTQWEDGDFNLPWRRYGVCTIGRSPTWKADILLNAWGKIIEAMTLNIFYTSHKYKIIRFYGKAKGASVVYSRTLYQISLFYIFDRKAKRKPNI